MKSSEYILRDTRSLEYRDSVEVGDLFLLGRHRLLCGDSTSDESLLRVTNEKSMDSLRVTNEKSIDSMFTSPPYKMSHNLSWKNKNSELRSKYILPETIDNYTEFLTTATNKALDHCEFAFVNLQSLSNNKVDLIEYQYNLRNRYVDVLIWDKGYTAFPVVPNVLRSDFEYLFIFSKTKLPKRTIRCAPAFHGSISNVQHIRRHSRNKYSDVHNATFPQEFSDFVIGNLCGNSVLDMFAGTGTTLMSSEKFGKTWHGIEIVPEYCKLIITRWLQYGGEVEKEVREE